MDGSTNNVSGTGVGTRVAVGRRVGVGTADAVGVRGGSVGAEGAQAERIKTRKAMVDNRCMVIL